MTDLERREALEIAQRVLDERLWQVGGSNTTATPDKYSDKLFGDAATASMSALFKQVYGEAIREAMYMPMNRSLFNVSEDEK